jgi:signal transduction histidine kinase
MSLKRHCWLVGTGIVLLVSATMALAIRPGFRLTAFGDLTALLLFVTATALIFRNAVTSTGQTRAFWSLIALGFLMWTANHASWTCYELVLKRDIPDPFAGDIVLFLHLVPFMAALALRPHRVQEEAKFYLSTLNFLMILVWWVFLYTSVVFPDEYVVTNVRVYSRNYDLLYLLENLLVVAGLGLAVLRTQGPWKNLYANLLGASFLYTIASELMNAAISRGRYYSGSLYDSLFFAALCWFVWTAIEGRRLALQPGSPSAQPSRWVALAPRFAMLAILSLPAFGLSVLVFDTSVPRLRQFRLFACLVTMLVLGAAVFLKQYLLDHQLMKLVESSDRSYEDLQRLQDELVQKEKLASLGQLVAGAAHEINNPVTAILGYSEILSSDPSVPPEQVSMARKIGQQARRTRDLVSDLLSFAQQTPTEKASIDVGMLLQRAVQMEIGHTNGKNIRIELKVTPSLPEVVANANQLLQSFVQIIGNAVDALDEVGGGTIVVSAAASGPNVVLEFSDTGPGIREPQRVFDPFYTTKPIGKGTGLGLSATYGVIQKHGGQISCSNKPAGGALFVVRLPAAHTTPPLSSGAAYA